MKTRSLLAHGPDRQRLFGRGDRGLDPRPALHAPDLTVRRGEDRYCEAAVVGGIGWYH